jgi:hypothetical protein
MKICFIVFVVSALTAINLFIFDKACDKKTFNAASLNKQNIVSLNNQTEEKVKIASVFPENTKWTPTPYQGLKPGKATYNDVKKILGNPRWEGGNEDPLFENDSEFELLLQYANVGAEEQAVEVVIGRKTKIVKAISFYPNPEMTKQEAILKYGTDYFETASGESICVRENLKKGVSEKHLDYPILLVYPEKGMTVTVGEDGMVSQVSLLYKCLE